MTHLNANKDILDLFRLSNKPVPTEDSNMGRAVAILQKICDSQSHTIPDASELADEMAIELENAGWTIFPGNSAHDPFAVRRDFGEYKTRHDDNSRLVVIAMAAATQGLDIDVGSEIFEALEEIEEHIASNTDNDDFRLEFDGAKYRLIKRDEDVIWPIYRDEIQNVVEECYTEVLDLSKIPPFISISVDWEQTAKNAYADGYGHQFSGYDGSEEEAGGYYIFRTN